jgi:hypothetical protein
MDVTIPRQQLHPAFHWDDEVPRIVLSKDGSVILATSFPLSLIGSHANAKKYTAVSVKAGTSVCLIQLHTAMDFGMRSLTLDQTMLFFVLL